MKHIFKQTVGFRVEDGTIVFPFLNSNDSQGELPFGMLDDVSKAKGQIGGSFVTADGEEIFSEDASQIHIMPHVTQITEVVRGRLKTIMKSPDSPEPYTGIYEVGQAAVTKAGTYLQLINDGDEPCLVNYTVTPAYLFVMRDGDATYIYDDSVVIDEDWDQLRALNWECPKPLPPIEVREAALTLLKYWSENSSDS